MHDPYRKLEEAMQAAAGVRVGAGAVLDQRAVIDDVAGEQDAGSALEQGDATGRMAGRVDDLEHPVAEIDHIAVVEQAGGRGGLGA